MKVLLHFAAGPALQDTLKSYEVEGFDTCWCAEDDTERFDEILGEVEVLFHVLRPVTRDVIDRAPRLRLIQKLGAGVDTIDLEAARSRGIAVANLPGVNAPAVAEATLLLMLATLRRVVSFDRELRAGRGWPVDPAVVSSLGELAGRTVGLVGFGDIARTLAPVLDALGADVIHHRRTGSAADPGWVPLEELLSRSDVVSLHLPLTAETERLLDATRLAKMAPGAVLINTSRGAVVDEAALVAALREGRLAGAGLDVFAIEPVDTDNPLLSLDNVVLTPHVAWLTAETLTRSINRGIENARRLKRGDALQHRIV